MGKYRYGNRRRPSVTLDAGYVAIQAVNICQSSKIIGLHGKKLICVISTVITLFLISFINLTCLVWILYKLDWSPFHNNNGSKVFRFDKLNQRIELYNQGIFKEAVYTTEIKSLEQFDLLSEKQIDIYGDHNSILFDDNQMSMNTEYFYMKNKSLASFNNLHLFKFDNKRRTKIHLDHVVSQHIHNKYLNLTTNNYLTISNVNKVFFNSPNLTLETSRYNRQSILRFNNYPKRRRTSNLRQKTSYGNMNIRCNSVFLDLPHLTLLENNYQNESNIYRICICNTTLLLLRSFAHQPCPLC